jgi:hypothetical protein
MPVRNLHTHLVQHGGGVVQIKIREQGDEDCDQMRRGPGGPAVIVPSPHRSLVNQSHYFPAIRQVTVLLM